MDIVEMLGLNELKKELDAERIALSALPRPMLASNLVENNVSHLGELKYPCYASFKIDGYRCIIWHGRAWTRSGKEHQAPAVRALARELESVLKLGDSALDGELVVPGEDFNRAGGKLRRMNYTGPVELIVYDLIEDSLNFRTRREILGTYRELLRNKPEYPVKFLRHWWIEDEAGLLALEKDALGAGYEGLCTRAPYGKYKHGRGTLRDQVLLKLKRWGQAEAKIVGVEPRMENQNEAQEEAWGLTKRSSAKDGLVETDALGAFLVEGINGPFTGVEFRIGSFLGLLDEDKRDLWRTREDLIGQVVTFKYLPIGGDQKPRHPVFLGFRPDWDMDRGGKDA